MYKFWLTHKMEYYLAAKNIIYTQQHGENAAAWENSNKRSVCCQVLVACNPNYMRG
jgi:hypothetical protein